MKYSVLLLAVYLSCSLFQVDAPRLIHFLPRGTDVPGWVPWTTSFYSNDNPGRTMPFLRENGAVEMAAGQFSSVSDGTITITAEIIRFHNVMEAYGFFSIEKGPDRKSFSSGDDHYLTEEGLFFRLGDYCVRLKCGNRNNILKKDLSVFMGAISGNLAMHYDRRALPDYVGLFSEGNSPLLPVYYSRGIPGVPGSSEVFLLRRDVLGVSRTVFFMHRGSDYDTVTAFNGLCSVNNANYIMTNYSGRNTALRKNDTGGFLAMSHLGKYIFGVLDADTIQEGGKIIVELSNHIHK